MPEAAWLRPNRARTHKDLSPSPGLYEVLSETRFFCGKVSAFMRRLVLPEPVKDRSVTRLREKLAGIGARVVRNSRYVIFQLAEVAVPREVFAAILCRIHGLAPAPT